MTISTLRPAILLPTWLQNRVKPSTISLPPAATTPVSGASSPIRIGLGLRARDRRAPRGSAAVLARNVATLHRCHLLCVAGARAHRANRLTNPSGAKIMRTMKMRPITICQRAV